MKIKNKKGISLIVLVITIIVMIILAAAVIIAMSNNGVIDRANQAVNLTNEKQVQDLASLVWAEAYLDENRKDPIEEVVKDKLEEQGITEDDWNINVSNTGVSLTLKNPSGGSNTSGDTNETYTLSGKWVFNESLNLITMQQDIEFTYYYEKTSANRPGTNMFVDAVNEMIYYDGSMVYDAGWIGGSNVDFGYTPQAVSEEFYNWFTANAEEYIPNLITFTIFDYNFQAEEGMTWEQWVNSKYNQPITTDYGDIIEIAIKYDSVYFIQNDTINDIIGEFIVAYDIHTSNLVELTDIIQAIKYYC